MSQTNGATQSRHNESDSTKIIHLLPFLHFGEILAKTYLLHNVKKEDMRVLLQICYNA